MSKLRRISSQLCGVFVSSCIRFAYGSILGFDITLIMVLLKPNSDIPITLNQLTWIGNLMFLNPLAAIINGLISQHFGHRVMMLLSMCLLITSWLLYYFATNAAMILVGKLLNVWLSVEVLTSTYITEISEPRLRGSFLVIANLALAFGLFFSMLLTYLMSWRNVALVNLLLPVLAIVLVLLTPDSPFWLASKGRRDEAKKALCWLRGWVQPSEVKTEYRSLIKKVKKSTPDNCKLDQKVVGCQESCGQCFQPFFQRSFYMPLGLISFFFFLYHFSGMDVVRNYSKVIFEQIDSPINPPIVTLIMGVTRIFGSLIILFSIHKTGKRKLALCSLVVTGLCNFLVAIVGLSGLQYDYPWISPIAISIAAFSNHSGVDSVCQMLNTEIFPASMRYIGSSIGNSVSMIMYLIVNKSFPYMVDAISLSGVFLCFAIVNFIAVVSFYFLFPETEGKSLEEIEDHFTEVKNLNEPEGK